LEVDLALYRLYREFFRALANQTRFAIVQLLRTGPHHVGQIGEKLGSEQSRVSHNLGCLLNCGFVLWEWQGKNKVYRLHPDLIPILAGIEKHLARYAPALESCGVLDAESKPVVIIPRTSHPERRPGRVRKLGVTK
jgi:DNA-binding transcriptional ArsR family regulator